MGVLKQSVGQNELVTGVIGTNPLGHRPRQYILHPQLSLSREEAKFNPVNTFRFTVSCVWHCLQMTTLIDV
jgi:hypothetical protein